MAFTDLASQHQAEALRLLVVTILKQTHYHLYKEDITCTQDEDG